MKRIILLLVISLYTICALFACSFGNENENTYTITWKNYDGTILEIDNDVKYGTIPTYDGITPIKPSDETYTYTFVGWDKKITQVYGNTIYTAKYKILPQWLTHDYVLNNTIGGCPDEVEFKLVSFEFTEKKINLKLNIRHCFYDDVTFNIYLPNYAIVYYTGQTPGSFMSVSCTSNPFFVSITNLWRPASLSISLPNDANMTAIEKVEFVCKWYASADFIFDSGSFTVEYTWTY